MRNFLIPIFPILFCLFSCSNNDINEAKVKTIDESQILLTNFWQLVEVNGKKIKKQTEDYVTHIKFFHDGESLRIAGFAGCNRILGKFETKKTAININTLASTKLMCNEHEAETKFISLLDDVDSYKIDNNTLYLFKKNTLALTFNAIDSDEH